MASKKLKSNQTKKSTGKLIGRKIGARIFSPVKETKG